MFGGGRSVVCFMKDESAEVLSGVLMYKMVSRKGVSDDVGHT